VSVRLPRELGTKLAAWIELQPAPKPTRSEAIRRLIEKGIEDKSGPNLS
jgi:metal-responsive CopG/Arc/MetJ family transcriptional regulator